MVAANTYTPEKSHKFSFGLWTVGWVGRDPFGEPFRPPLDPVYTVKKLAEVNS